MGLLDLRYSGLPCNNKRNNEEAIYERLDRALSNY